MRARLALAGSLALGLAASVPAFAQVLPAPEADMVERLARFARENVTRARLLDGSHVPAETPAELARPIVPAALAAQTVARAYLTAELEACAMDWQEQSYLPYMRRLRASRRYGDKQMAYLGLLHGLSQAVALRALAGRGPCSDEEKRGLLRVVAERAVETP